MMVCGGCAQEASHGAAEAEDAVALADGGAGSPDGVPSEGVAPADADLSSDADTLEDSPDSAQANVCAFPLVVLQTGKSPQCGGGNVHQWPIGMAADDCHGWSAMDSRGGQHHNSANGIGCEPDGVFRFTQFAGNLDCSGTGTLKVFSPGQCQQDIPPVLYTEAVNLACCEDIAHPECLTGVPSVTVPGGAVFLNGEACDPHGAGR